MKSMLLAVFFAQASFAAQDCAKWDPKWMECKVSADCTVVEDECGIVRWTVNKTSVKHMAAHRQCKNKAAECPRVVAGFIKSVPPFKCHNKTCLRLSDVVGEAIQKGDRQLLMSTLEEAKVIDLSLSHIHETPLTLAAMNSRHDMVKLLLAKGADVNHKTVNGYTALIFAGMSRNQDRKAAVETIKMLLAAGADKTAKNDRGETAADLAKQLNNDDILTLLQ